MAEGNVRGVPTKTREVGNKKEMMIEKRFEKNNPTR